MAKSMFAGMTDYSHQSIDDIINDLDYEYRNISAFIEMILKNKAILEANQYWENKVPSSFESVINYALKHYDTTQSELEEIKTDILDVVEGHHVKRLYSLATVANEIYIEIGKKWHQDYGGKDYGNANFSTVERIYADTR